MLTFLRPIPLVGVMIGLLESADKDFSFGKYRYRCEGAYLLSSWDYLQLVALSAGIFGQRLRGQLIQTKLYLRIVALLTSLIH